MHGDDDGSTGRSSGHIIGFEEAPPLGGEVHSLHAEAGSHSMRTSLFLGIYQDKRSKLSLRVCHWERLRLICQDLESGMSIGLW